MKIILTLQKKGLKMSRIYRNIYMRCVKQDISNKDVHHIDLNHNNNDISNLVAVSKSFHRRLHRFYHDCEILDILEKYENDGIIKYYSKSPLTAVKDRWINAKNYKKRFDFLKIENKITNEIPELMKELDLALKEKNKMLM